MNRLLKIIATVLTLIVLIIVIAIVVMILCINPNRFKPLIIKQIQHETGRRLSIPGNLTWSFFPTIRITTGEITLSNPKGYTQKIFLHAEHASAQVRLFPLLSGNVTPKELAITGATLYLIKNKKGQENWRQWSTNKTAKTLSVKQTTASTHHDFNIETPNIDIKNASLTYIDETTQKQFALTQLNLQVEQAHLNTPFPLHFSTHFSSKLPKASGEISVNATVKLADQAWILDNIALQGKIASQQTQFKQVPIQLTANAILHKNAFNLQPAAFQIANLKATGYLGLQNFSGPTYKGAINISRFDAMVFLKTLGIQSHLQDATALSNVSFSAAISGNPMQFTLNGLTAKLNNASIKGKLTLNNLKTKTGKFTLYADHLNMDDFLQKTASSKNTKTAEQNQKAPLNLPNWLKAYDMAGNFSAKDLTVNKLHFDTLEAQMIAHYGYITFYPLTAELYHGKLSGSLSTDFRPPQAIFSGRLRLEGIDLNPMLSDLYNNKKASGKLFMHTNVKTHGNNRTTLIQHLNGQLDLHLKEGAIKNLDLDYYYKAGLALLSGKKPSVKKGNLTNIGNLTALYNLKKGIAYNNNLRLNSHDFTLTGTGKINLNNNTLQYLLHLKDRQQNSIPLQLSGHIISPEIQIDKSLFTKQLRHKAEEHFREALKKKISGDSTLKNALSHLGI